MKPTLICLSVLLLCSQIVLAADPVPKIDIGRSCQSAGAAPGAATRDKAACEQSENNARATLEKEWSQFTPLDRGYCEKTGEPISLRRLEARPIATLSVEAQERHERRERIYRDDWMD